MDMLEVESQLEAAGTSHPRDNSSEAGLQSAQSSLNGTFYSSGKGGTWKKLKKMVKHKKEGSEAGAASKSEGGGAHHSSMSAHSTALPIDPTISGISITSHSQQDDADSEITTSGLGRGSRMSMRQEGGWEGEECDSMSNKGTLKGMFKKQKKSRQIELDALRFEMGQLQERHDHAERDLASVRHDIGQLTAERDHLANQVHELTNALTLARSDLTSTEAERARLKELHSQVKAALQESYSNQQDQQKQIKELEELCGAQQNSLEEGEERYRALQNEQDQLHHAALASKAQLVTAQAQLAEARTQREELMAELATLNSQAASLQSEIDSRDEKMSSLEAAAEQANKGLEVALSRLRELEHEQQQLEMRVNDLQEENLELSTELSGVTELRRQLEGQLSDAHATNSSLQAQVSTLQAALDKASHNEAALMARLTELNSQLASSSEAGGSLRAHNGELLAELQMLREQQQQRKQSSPLSKWHKNPLGSRPATSSSTPATGPASGNSSSSCTNAATAGAATSTGTAAAAIAPAAGSAASGFSPMTSQLPAVRPASLTLHAACGVDDNMVQACLLADGTGTPNHADSSCLVTAASDAAGVAAPGAAEEASVTASAASLALKPPVSSSSPDIAVAKAGPLTASRPAGRRTSAVPAFQGGRQSSDAAGAKATILAGPQATRAAQRKLSFGLNDVTPTGPNQRSQGDLFSRLFVCFTPRVAEVV